MGWKRLLRHMRNRCPSAATRIQYAKAGSQTHKIAQTALEHSGKKEFDVRLGLTRLLRRLGVHVERPQ